MKPELLNRGDCIGLVATAKPVIRAEIAPFKALMQEWGLTVLEGQHLYDSHHHFAGTDENRAKDFIDMWQNPKVKAIFCARGGYGSIRMLKHFPENLFKSNSKLLIGYSDITTLHMALNSHNISSLHGPMALNAFVTNTQTSHNFKRLEKALFHGEISVDLRKCESINAKPFEGKLLGGNLSLIAASLGAPEQLNTKNSVLFIEEIDEYLYHFDRIMQTLDRAQLFKPLTALIVGGMSKMKDNEVKFGRDAKEIILDICKPYDFPIIFNFPAGHGAKNFPIYMGSICKFEKGILSQSLE
jgi:muramoyltetrapeptide carboxypeptidase